MGGSSFRGMLRQERPLIGTIVSIPSLDNIEILSRVGFDWLFLDLEHSAISTSQAQAILQVAAGNVHCIARVARGDELEIKRALDIGCDGIIVPMVNSREQAEAAIRFAKYPPMGTRSVGIARAHGFGPGFGDYVATANDEKAVIVQIEHQDGVRNLDEILGVEGIDAILIGPYDLSASMNLTGQVGHPDVVSAISRVRSACQEKGLPYGFFGVTAEACLVELRNGAGFVVVGTDALHLINGAKAALGAITEFVHSVGV